jgi:hypothetical protein
VRKDSRVEGEHSNSRWTTESIEAKLEEIASETGGKTPTNIWVCGTPSMNQTFEMAFADLQRRGKISNLTNIQIL